MHFHFIDNSKISLLFPYFFANKGFFSLWMKLAYQSLFELTTSQLKIVDLKPTVSIEFTDSHQSYKGSWIPIGKPVTEDYIGSGPKLSNFQLLGSWTI